MDIVPASEELIATLDVPKRFEVARDWALGARDVAELTKHKVALRLWDFIDNRTTVAAPMPGGGISYFFLQEPEQEFGYYAYLTPVLQDDAKRLSPQDFRVAYASGYSAHVAEYREKSQAIYLPNSEFGRYGKGVLLLHEALHAWLDIKQRANSKKKLSHWTEEVRVFKFEFELLESIIGPSYLKICARMSESIKPLEEDEKTLTMDYRPEADEEEVIREKMKTANEKETSLWLGVCKINAYWLYFVENYPSADAELAKFLKARGEPAA